MKGDSRSSAQTTTLIALAALGIGAFFLFTQSESSGESSKPSKPPLPVPDGGPPAPPPDGGPPAPPPDGGPPAPPPDIKPPPPIVPFDRIAASSNILLMGDSLAVGMSSQFKKRASQDGYKPFVQSVNSQRDYTPGVSAVVGTTMRFWKNKMPTLLSTYKPALVLVSLGTNDALLSDPTVETPDLEEIIGKIKESGAVLAWIGPPTLPSTIGAQPVRLDTIVEMIKPRVSHYYDSRILDIPRSGDKIHPATLTAYANWFDQVWEWLKTENIIGP